MRYANTSMKPLAKIVKIENLNIQIFVKKIFNEMLYFAIRI